MGALIGVICVLAVIKSSQFFVEKGVSREVLGLLLDKVCPLLALFDSLSLIVEEFEEDSSKRFDLVNGTRSVNFYRLRLVNSLRLPDGSVKADSALVSDRLGCSQGWARLTQLTGFSREESS